MAASATSLEKNGPLQGLGILRFAHAFESGGGTERYLDDLDQALLQRNAMTVVRLHLTRRTDAPAPSTETIGKGQLIRVPLMIRPDHTSAPAPDDHSAQVQWKQKLRDAFLYHPLIWHTVGKRWALRRPLLPKPGQALGAGEAAAEAFRLRPVDLVMLHFFGGADAGEVIAETRKAGLPLALLNHYANDRYLHLAIRQHALQADALAGVNGLGLPPYVRSRFTNLSDGVDTDFFKKSAAKPLPPPPARPVVLLPARVVREKGQLDLVRAVAALDQTGLECDIALAGRVDSSGFREELEREIAQSRLQNRVHFLGPLNLEQLRDWYASSAVLALPTYHHEGLPRVILEAQAMNLPVVAYATGGVADGIIPGKTGCLLETGDIAGLTTALRDLISSPERRDALGAAGRKEAEARFSLSALAARHEQFCLNVIATRKNRRTLPPSA